MRAELLIFDCDGVLVDSEALVMEVEAAMLTAAGYPITVDEIADRFVGLSYATMLDELGAEHGRPVPAALGRRVRQAALDELSHRLRPVKGIEALLEGLDRPRCVASSSDLDRIELSLTVTELGRFFEPGTVFSAQMVERGKPAPDLFELAAARLGAEPRTCMVIEDSPAGVTAARAAGMDVVGLVAGRHARPDLADRLLAAGARAVFETAAALADHLTTGRDRLG